MPLGAFLSTMQKWFKKIPRIPLLVLSVALLIVIVYLASTPLDLSRYNSSIASGIEERINGKIRIESIKLKVFPWPIITLKGVTVSDETSIVIQSDSTTMGLSIISILKRDLVVDKIKLVSPSIFIKREDDGSINLAKLLKRRRFPVFPSGTTIRDGYIQFSDKHAEEEISHEFSGVNVALKMKNGELLYELSGTISPSTTVAFHGKASGFDDELSVDGKMDIKALDALSFKPYLETLLSDMELDAKMDLSAEFAYKGDKFSLKGLVAYRSLTASIPSISAKPIFSQEGSSHIEIQRDGDSTEVVLSNCKTIFDKFNIDCGLKFTMLPTGDHIAMEISSTPIPISSVKYYLETVSLPSSAIALRDDLTLYSGDITINALALSGTVKELSIPGYLREPGVITANLYLNKVGFAYTGFQHIATDISGNIIWDEGWLYIKDFKGSYGKSVIYKLNGRVKGGDYGFKIQSTLDAQESMKELRRLMKGEKFKLFGKIEPTGTLSLDLEVKRREDSGNRPHLNGKVLIKGVGMTHADYPLPLRSISGELIFEQDKVTLKGINGNLGKTTFSLDGTVANYLDDKPTPSLEFSGKLTEDAIKVAFKDHLLEGLVIEDWIEFSGKIEGRNGQTSISAKLDTTTAQINYKPFIEKRKNYPLTIDLNLLSNDSGLTVDKALIDIGGSSLLLTGKVPKDKGNYSLSIKAEELLFDDLDMILPHLKGDFASSGSISLSLDLFQKAERKIPLIKGEARINGGNFVSHLLPSEISNLYTTIRFEDDSARCIIENLSIGRSKISGKVEFLDTVKGIIDFDLVSSHMDLKDILPKYTGDKAARKPYRPNITGKGKLTIKDGKVFGMDIASFQGNVSMDSEKIRISPITFISNDGHVSAEIEYFRQNVPKLFNVSMTLYKLDTESLLKELGVKANILSGKVDGTLEISGRRWVTPLRRGLEGTATLSSEKGMLWRFIVLSKIFSIVNIVSINESLEEGLPYKELSGDFLIRDGKIHSDNLFLESDVMRMSAIGTIDFVDVTVDATLGMHPFVMIDKVITNIPLAGWIIGGEEKSAINMYFEIKGPLKKPEVKPIPIESLGKSFLGIFLRLLETPARAVEPFIKQKQ
ncbi:MAG: AsmA-like C-terminal domain-containing protein [Thermodesulfobacteriota bacterium]